MLTLVPIQMNGQENNSILCSDGIDNDGDGLIDCLDGECASLSNDGCTICSDGISFADTLLEYTPGCPVSDPFPLGALGVSDWSGAQMDAPEIVFLGQGGVLKLGFTDNLLANSGNNQDDLFVFEVGLAIEETELALRPFDLFTETQLITQGFPDLNSDGYFEMGTIRGSTSRVDIDSLLLGFTAGELKFDAIELTDIVDEPCNNGTPGADIDAVCALFYIPIDCKGVLNGLAIIDDCGECNEPSEPSFNQSCKDCNGIPNGTSEIDYCGVCLEIIDPSFNTSCEDENIIYIPNAFSPNNDGTNDNFAIFKPQDKDAQIISYKIFNRWGELIYQINNRPFDSTVAWWNGKYNGEDVEAGTYVYLIEVKFLFGEVRDFHGNVTVTR